MANSRYDVIHNFLKVEHGVYCVFQLQEIRMSFLINNAVAATTAVSGNSSVGPSDSTFSLVIIVAMFILFYFMLVRPQNKRAKTHQNLISQLKPGDEVVTSGGLVGKITNLQEQFLKVALSQGIEVCIQRQAISAVLPKGTLKSLA